MAVIHDIAMERTMNGQRQAVYFKDDMIGSKIVFDNKLLMFMLRNREWLAHRRFEGYGTECDRRSVDMVYARASGNFDRGFGIRQISPLSCEVREDRAEEEAGPSSASDDMINQP